MSRQISIHGMTRRRWRWMMRMRNQNFYDQRDLQYYESRLRWKRFGITKSGGQICCVRLESMIETVIWWGWQLVKCLRVPWYWKRTMPMVYLSQDWCYWKERRERSGSSQNSCGAREHDAHTKVDDDDEEVHGSERKGGRCLPLSPSSLFSPRISLSSLFPLATLLSPLFSLLSFFFSPILQSLSKILFLIDNLPLSSRRVLPLLLDKLSALLPPP